jgi:hypothetical protein
MKRFTASLLCVLLLAAGCATSGAPRVQTAPPAPPRTADTAVLAEYAGQLKLGARVKATIANNRSIRGTLVKRTDKALIIQPRTRIAEPLVEVPFAELLALEEETKNGGVGRKVAIAVGVGAGAYLTMLLLFAALIGGS